MPSIRVQVGADSYRDGKDRISVAKVTPSQYRQTARGRPTPDDLKGRAPVFRRVAIDPPHHDLPRTRQEVPVQ